LIRSEKSINRLMKNMPEMVEECDYTLKLAITQWVFRKIVEHRQRSGSYRYLIYDRLGFEANAYATLF
jgi:hypothetical protein